MVKPNKEYLQDAENNSERIRRLRSRIMTGVVVAGATVAAALSLNGVNSSEGKNNAEPKPNAKEIPVPSAAPQDDGKTAYPFGYSDPNENPETPEQKAEREAEEEFERIRAGEYTHGDAGTGRALKGVQMGERQGTLKEGDIPQYTLTGASPQYDDEPGVEHNGFAIDGSEIPSESKGIRTWQNEDEDVSQMIKDRMNSRFDVSTKAQKEMASQLMKHIKSNHSDYD